VNKKDISWKSDRDHKFGSDVFPKNFQKGTLIGGKMLNSSIPVRLQIFHSIIKLSQYLSWPSSYTFSFNVS
jgi:hypothetical protein